MGLSQFHSISFLLISICYGWYGMENTRCVELQKNNLLETFSTAMFTLPHEMFLYHSHFFQRLKTIPINAMHGKAKLNNSMSWAWTHFPQRLGSLSQESYFVTKVLHIIHSKGKVLVCLSESTLLQFSALYKVYNSFSKSSTSWT